MRKTQIHGGWAAFDKSELDRTVACLVCGAPLPKDALIQRLYCSVRCKSAAKRGREKQRQIIGGSRTAYSVIATGEDASGNHLSVVGWGRGKRAARDDAIGQLAQKGFEPVCFSTPDSILADLHKTTP